MKTANLSFTEAVDFLTYSSYRRNRQISPEVNFLRWGAIYGDKLFTFEAMYQSELSDGQAAA